MLKFYKITITFDGNAYEYQNEVHNHLTENDDMLQLSNDFNLGTKKSTMKYLTLFVSDSIYDLEDKLPNGHVELLGPYELKKIKKEKVK